MTRDGCPADEDGFVLAWIARRERLALAVLVLAAIVARGLLVVGAPTPMGYFYDRYDRAVRLFHAEGRLPESTDCIECYHPPLFPLLGYAFFSAGMRATGGDVPGSLRVLTLLSGLCTALIAWYGFRLLRLFGQRGWPLVAGTGLLLVLPALFLASCTIDADVVAAAVLSGFLFHLTRYVAAPDRHPRLDLMGAGLFAGLAASTKYSGLTALAVAGLVFAIRLLLEPNRRRTLAHGLALLVLCVAVGSWKYVDNVRKYGTPLFSRGYTYHEVLGVGNRHWDRYEFLSFRLPSLLAVATHAAPPGPLTLDPVYRSVWTTLYGQTWGDMGFFSNPTRHGSRMPWFPDRGVPPWLTLSVLLLGLVPSLVAGVGLVATARQRALWPVLLTCAVTLGVYIAWFTTERNWGLKVKYVLHLAPAYALYLGLGFEALRCRLPRPAIRALAGLTLLLLALAYAWDVEFAVGVGGDAPPREWKAFDLRARGD